MQKLQDIKNKRNTNGFTIIEVVLVLAIAGLIFLMVFIALPALQRSQADTQRRSDAGRFLSQLSNYQTNNRGNLPATNGAGLNTFITGYMTTNGETFNDPSSGSPYAVSTAAPTAIGQIQYVTGTICNQAGAGVTGGQGARKAAVIVALSNVSTNGASYVGTYCTSN